MKAAFVIAVLIGAVIGLLIGLELEAQHLRDTGMLQAVENLNDNGPFFRVGSFGAAIGALIGAGVVYIVRAMKRTP